MIDAAAPATSPTQIPPRGWKEVLKATWREAGDDNVTLLAAGVAFYAFSALVPLLTALVLSYGLVAEPSSVVSHVQTLTGVMPKESAALIGEQLRNMTESAGAKTGFALALALLVALYGASKGAGAVITALDIAYGVEEKRGFVTRTLMAIGLVVGALLVMLLAIFAVSAMNLLQALLPDWGGVGQFALQLLSFGVAGAMVILLLAVIYRYGPDRPDAKWRWITPGSILATLVWILATLGFGFYVANFGSYNATYGSLGAVIVFLTWLYLTAYIVLLGAELNAVLEQEVAAAPKKGAPSEPAAPANEAGSAADEPETQPPSAGGLLLRLAAASLLVALLGGSSRRGDPPAA